MKSKFATGYLIFSMLFLLGIAGWLGIGINSARNSARAECERQFSSLKDAIAASYLIDSRFDAPYFLDLIKRSIASQQRLKALVIGTQAAGVEYVYASDKSYIPQGPPYPEKTPPPVPSYNSFSEILLSAPVFLPVTTGLSVQAVYQTFSRSDITSILKSILIAIILFLIVTSIILIVFSVRDNKNEPREESTGTGKSTAAAEPSDSEKTPISQAGTSTDSTESAVSAESPESAGTPAPADTALPAQSSQPAQSAPSGSPDVSPDGGLFSTRSGLGWESYLEQRLDSELKRAASFDQDLSCVAFACDDSCSDTDYHKAAQRILETFMFKDLAFEYGKNGFVVILPNIDLDQALIKVEGFIKRIEEIPHSLLLHAGISSRNGRLMHANLLLKEAVRGLEKARCEGENRIIAFRTDPTRYRQFIAAKD